MLAGQQTPSNNNVVALSLVTKLTAPFQAAVNGKPLRELLHQIADAADFNLWIDRNIDPDQLVSLPNDQRTVFTSLADASRAGGADVVAVGNVVLVGQRQRIEQLTGAILALPLKSPSPTSAATKIAAGQTEFLWPEATTPTEALRIVAGQETVELPHDHWPEAAWRDISPQVATLLVTSQFDLMPLADEAVAGNAVPQKTLGQTRTDRPSLALPNQQGAPKLTAMKLAPLAAPAVLTLRYPAGDHAQAIRKAAATADPRATLSQPREGNNSAGLVELAGSPAAHVAAIIAMLSHAKPRIQAGVDIDNVRFTLSLRGAPAQDVLAQLAAAAGRKLRVSDEAGTMMQRTITLNVQDQSLRQLVKTVTDQIGASAQWSDDTVTITPSP
ncbi:MAG TPA: hypothetical protein DDZ51_11145 [Planctomycetaceae bacterium]|nr:hypothetical protein [Planctomycetaceae bacterium]